ncbi:MAG: hypothetical protein ACM3UZ_02970 [Acidobacteriota bacterium]
MNHEELIKLIETAYWVKQTDIKYEVDKEKQRQMADAQQRNVLAGGMKDGIEHRAMATLVERSAIAYCGLIAEYYIKYGIEFDKDDVKKHKQFVDGIITPISEIESQSVAKVKDKINQLFKLTCDDTNHTIDKNRSIYRKDKLWALVPTIIGFLLGIISKPLSNYLLANLK